jgi:hypothetical protein
VKELRFRGATLLGLWLASVISLFESGWQARQPQAQAAEASCNLNDVKALSKISSVIFAISTERMKTILSNC